MGQQTSALRFTGKLGGMIGYSRDGKDYVRMCPVTVKQTRATRRAAREFGKASSAAAVIRHALQNLAHTRYDKSFQNRLNKKMGEVLRADTPRHGRKRHITTANLRQLIGFKVNGHTPISHYTLTQRTYDGSVIVTIPQPLINFPDKTQYMQFRAMAVCADFPLGGSKTVVSETVMLSRAEATQGLTLTLPLKGKQEAIIFLEALSYTQRDGELVQDMHRYRNGLEVIAIVPGVKKGEPNKGFAGAPIENYSRLVNEVIPVFNSSSLRRRS